MKIPRLRSHQEIGGESGKDCVLLCGREAQPNSGLNGGLFFSDNEKAEGSFQLTALPCDLHPPAYHLVVNLVSAISSPTPFLSLPRIFGSTSQTL